MHPSENAISDTSILEIREQICPDFIGELCKLHHDRLLRIVRSWIRSAFRGEDRCDLHHNLSADDIVQNAWKRLLGNLPSLQGEIYSAPQDSFPLVCKYAKMEYLTIARSIARRRSLLRIGFSEVNVSRITTSGPDHTKKFEREDTMNFLLRIAISTLSEEDQKLFQMHFEDGMSYREIQSEIGYSLGYISNHMQRIRDYLLRHLAEQGYEDSSES